MFKNLPGDAAFDKELNQHVDKLRAQATTTVLTTTKAEGWQKQISSSVLLLGRVGSEIPRASKNVKAALADVLDAVEQKFGAQDMPKLAMELRERDAALGQEIIAASPAFVYVKVADFNQKTKRDISEVKRLYKERNGTEVDAVWNRYDEFRNEYERLLREVTDDVYPRDDPLGYLINAAKTAAKSDRDFFSYRTQQNMPIVLAAIFAWWSVNFFEELKKRNPLLKADPEKLLQPNSVQVVCILRLLGAKEKLRNHLAEVPTGEGKSVILGVLATTLALCTPLRTQTLTALPGVVTPLHSYPYCR